MIEYGASASSSGETQGEAELKVSLERLTFAVPFALPAYFNMLFGQVLVPGTGNEFAVPFLRFPLGDLTQ